MWIIVAVLAFFFLAIASVSDKFVLSKSPIVPVSYAFYVCALGGVISSVLLFFAPEFKVPGDSGLWWALLGAGGGFYLAIYLMYLAVKRYEISRVNPLIVSLTPLAVLVFSLMLGLGGASWGQMLGAGLLIVGSYFLSQVGAQKNQIDDPKAWMMIIGSVLMFALSNSLSKVVYNQLDFINAFVWIRWMSVAVAIVGTTILGGWDEVIYQRSFREGEWEKIYHRIAEKAWKYTVKICSPVFDLERLAQNKARRQWMVLLIGQSAGALGTILSQYAIKLGNVFLVTALNGLQFFFIIFMMYFLTNFFPKVLKEDTHKKFVGQKLWWTAILAIGMVFIIWD